jgi:hypothetical protein
MGPRAGLEAAEKRKTLSNRKSTPERPARSSLLYRLSYPNSSMRTMRMKINPTPESNYV